MKKYLAEIRRHDVVIERLCIFAATRREAVYKAELEFWYTYRGSLGPSFRSLTVSDPYREARYSDAFRCNDRANLFLPEWDVIRILHEAGGELVRNNRPYRRGLAHSPFRRLRRRRDFGKFIAPAIKQMKNGRLYYRVNLLPQIVHNGRRYRKRRYRDVPLSARTLSEAIDEIRARKLLALHKVGSIRVMRVRSLRRLRRLAA